MDEMLPLKAQEFLELVGNWVLLDESWAGTGASLVLVRLEVRVVSRHAAGWDLTLPQEIRALPLGWAHNTERNTLGWCVSTFLNSALCVSRFLTPGYFVSRFLLCLRSHASHQGLLKSGVGRIEGLSQAGPFGVAAVRPSHVRSS